MEWVGQVRVCQYVYVTKRDKDDENLTFPIQRFKCGAKPKLVTKACGSGKQNGNGETLFQA